MWGMALKRLGSSITNPVDIAQYYGYMLRVHKNYCICMDFRKLTLQKKGKKFDCDKLKVSLQDTLLSNPNHEATEEENAFDFEIAEIIEYSEGNGE